MKQRTKAIIGVALVGAGLAALLLVSTRGDDAASDRTGAGTALGADGTAGMGGAGAQVTRPLPSSPKPWSGLYRFTFDASLKTAGGSLQGLPTDGQWSLEGTLELATSPVGPEWLAGRLHDVRVTGTEALLSGAGLSPTMPAAALEAPFMVRFDASGMAVERRYDEAMPLGLRNTLATVVLALQVVEPEGSDGLEWEADEHGLDGELHATYQARADSVSKRWVRADNGVRTQENPGAARTNGEVEELLTDGVLARAKLNVGVDLSVALSDLAAVHITSETHAAMTRTGAVPAEWALSLKPAMLAATDGVAAYEKTANVEHLPKASGRSAADILAAAVKAHDDQHAGARRDAARDLAATVRADPKALAFVEESLHQEGVDGEQLRTLVTSLVGADTPASLATMNKLLGDTSVPRDTRHSLATAVAFMDHPTKELISTIAALSAGPLDDVGTAALLALGAQGNPAHRVTSHTDGIRADLIERGATVLTPHAASAGADPTKAPGTALTTVATVTSTTSPVSNADPGVIQAWLSGMGNMGGAEVWPLIKPYLTHEDEWVRRTAVGSLNFVPGPEARLAVAERITVDPSHWVRREAVRMAGDMGRKAFEDIVIRTLREDKEPDVRLECARVIAVWGVDAPALYDVLADATEREPDALNLRLMRKLQPVTLGTPGVDDVDGPGPGTVTP